MKNIFNYKKENGKIIITGLQEGITTTSIVIPDTIDNIPVTEILKKAFIGRSITDIKLGKNIKEVGEGAFDRCDKLKSVIWNNACEKIPEYCFAECLSLKHFDFFNIKIIEKGAFFNSGLKEIHLPSSVKEISEASFFNCTDLNQVIWDCNEKIVSKSCFCNCYSLKQFNFLNIRELKKGAFAGSGLTSVTLKKRTAVDQNCFAYCDQLKKVEWLSDHSIVDKVFENCQHLNEVIISDKVRNIAVDAFKGCPNVEFTFV